MANEKYFLRYIKILSRIKRADYPDLEEVLDYLSENGFDINKRTFNRDINAILELFDTEIYYNRAERGYEIKTKEEDFLTDKLHETLDLFASIKIAGKESKIISFEKRKAFGTEYMHIILDVIKRSKLLHFTHFKFHTQETTQRIVEPYILKESQGRWYLICKDQKDNKIKTFGLDRMSYLYTENVSFTKDKTIDFETMYKNSFGIVNINDPKNIKLKVYGANAFFIKSYKLHDSQCVVDKNEDSITFSLYLSVTDDFVMELMKYGADIEVLEPDFLRERLRKSYLLGADRNI